MAPPVVPVTPPPLPSFADSLPPNCSAQETQDDANYKWGVERYIVGILNKCW